MKTRFGNMLQKHPQVRLPLARAFLTTATVLQKGAKTFNTWAIKMNNRSEAFAATANLLMDWVASEKKPPS